MRKTLFFLVLFVFVLHAKTAQVTQHFNVVTTTVKKGRVRLSHDYYGYTAVDESKVTEVVPRFSGYVEKLHANRHYLYVKKGEILAEVYSPEVFKAKEEYLRSYRYGKRQNAHGMIRSAKLKLLLLGVSPKEAEEVIKKQRADENTRIYAPKSGYIFYKSINEGSSFAKGSKLFTIVSLEDVWLRIKVNDTDIEWVREVKNFDVRFDGLQKRFEAVLDMIEPKLDPKESRYTLRTVLGNYKEILYPGMYAKVTASKDLGEHLLIPASAVIRKNGKYYAFLATEFQGEF